ncbi:MAG: GTPase ObgE [Acidobacteriota bacterium]
MVFIDEAVIDAAAGNGGNGCIAFRREKYVPRGGPSGGDGGNGGSVSLVGKKGLNTLQHLRYRARMVAERGRHGEGSNRTGRRGKSLEIAVPLGTIAYDRETDELLGEILEEGESLLVAKGGLGGRGNARFVTPTRRAPRYAEDGREGEERHLRLELKLLADVGLVGLPNAGKSTLISALSAARPKVADYPFTTLVPQLGVVAEDALADPFVIADLPGLIAGAAQGSGLGFQFLRHIERCRVLAHLVDLSDPTSDCTEDLVTIEKELGAFNPDLLERTRVILGSKADAADEDRREALRAAAAARSLPYLEVSSATRQGLKELIFELRRRLQEAEVGL